MHSRHKQFTNHPRFPNRNTRLVLKRLSFKWHQRVEKRDLSQASGLLTVIGGRANVSTASKAALLYAAFAFALRRSRGFSPVCPSFRSSK